MYVCSPRGDKSLSDHHLRLHGENTKLARVEHAPSLLPLSLFLLLSFLPSLRVEAPNCSSLRLPTPTRYVPAHTTYSGQPSSGASFASSEYIRNVKHDMVSVCQKFEESWRILPQPKRFSQVKTEWYITEDHS